MQIIRGDKGIKSILDYDKNELSTRGREDQKRYKKFKKSIAAKLKEEDKGSESAESEEDAAGLPLDYDKD
jgi:hypothetical protein